MYDDTSNNMVCMENEWMNSLIHSVTVLVRNFLVIRLVLNI